MPVTIGGGLRSVDDVAAALRAGADKVAINTAAIKNPSIISDIARRFGSQCMVLSIQAKRQGASWEAYYDNGREHSGLDAIDWAKKGQDFGAGEIFQFFIKLSQEFLHFLHIFVILLWCWIQSAH